MGDVNHMRHFKLRCLDCFANLRRLQRASQEEPNFQNFLLWADKEVTCVTGKHDRIVGSVYSLLAKGTRGFTEPLPGVQQVFREVGREVLFCGGPAVVLLARFDPLMAVVALST